MMDDDEEMNRVATVRAESSFCNSAILNSLDNAAQSKMTGDRGTVSPGLATCGLAWALSFHLSEGVSRRGDSRLK